MTESSPLRFLAFAKVSERSRLCARCLKAAEDLRGAVVMAGSTTQPLGRRVMALETLLSQTAGTLWARLTVHIQPAKKETGDSSSLS